MSRKKLLFISGNIGPNSSQGVRYNNILPLLANEYDLFILSYNDFYEGEHIKKKVIKRNSKISNNNDVKSFGLKKELLNLYKKIIRPFVFPDKYKYSIKEYKIGLSQILKSEDIETVIIGMTPFSLYGLTEYIRGLDKKIKIIVDLSDPFSLNGANNYAFVYNSSYIRRYERNALKNVDDVVVLNPVIKELYEKAFNISNVHVIEQGVKEISPLVKTNDFLQKREVSLLYAGGLYKRFREAFELYKAIDILNANVSLDIYGNIDTSLLPENNAKVLYHGQVDHKELYQAYLDTDILVFIDNNRGYQVPGKILELIAMQKPVLFIYSNKNSPTLSYIKESEFVIKVGNSSNEIIEGIKRIQNTDFSKLKAAELSQYYWSSLISKYNDIISG